MIQYDITELLIYKLWIFKSNENAIYWVTYWRQRPLSIYKIVNYQNYISLKGYKLFNTIFIDISFLHNYSLLIQTYFYILIYTGDRTSLCYIDRPLCRLLLITCNNFFCENFFLIPGIREIDIFELKAHVGIIYKEAWLYCRCSVVERNDPRDHAGHGLHAEGQGR